MANRRSETRRRKTERRKAANAAITLFSNARQTNTQTQESTVPTIQQPKIRRHVWPATSFLWQSFLIILTLIGGLSGAYSLRPQITVTASESLNKNAPLEPLITISNTGILEVYNLVFACRSLEQWVADKELVGPHLAIENHQTKEPGDNIQPEKILHPQSSIARTCTGTNGFAGSHVVSVARTLQIDYSPSFWPWRVSKSARFKSRIDPSGKVQWISDPKDDPFDEG